jgi:hypothetical protein
MANENIGQKGIENSTPGRFGLYTQHDVDMGNSDGDTVDSTYSRNSVKEISFQRTRNLQGTGTTFYYPLGNSSRQEY